MNMVQFSRVPRLGAPFGGAFDFGAAPKPFFPGPIDLSPPDFSLPPAAPADGGGAAADAGPADADAAPEAPGFDALPPQMRPFYNYPAQDPSEQQSSPAAPPPSDGISTTTAVVIGAAALLGVVAMVALSSGKS